MGSSCIAVRATCMQTSMAASSHSADSHHATHNSPDNTTVPLMSYNIGITNKDVKGRNWAKPGGKLLKLKTDVDNIFKNQLGIQIALLSEMGNMVDKLKNSQQIFEGIITDLGLEHIEVKAHAPYVALIDTTFGVPQNAISSVTSAPAKTSPFRD